MSPCLVVQGIVPPDEKYKKMEEIYNLCKVMRIEPPAEVQQFFRYQPPDPAGMALELGASVMTPFNAEMQEGFDVQLDKLPPEIKILRVYISY